jgi:general secretion pathway protein D
LTVARVKAKYALVSRLLILSLLLLLSVGAVAQRPLIPGPGTPVTPTTGPGSTAASRTKYPPGSTVKGVSLPNADVKDVLRFYETITGKRVIYDIQALGQVNIELSDETPVEEVQRLVEISLIMNGFTLVPVDDNYVKLLGTGRNPRGYGIPLLSDELQIPEKEQVISFLFKLRYADPTEIATMLTAYISPSSLGYSQTLALPKSNSILVTENSIIIRKFMQIIREVDTPPAEVVSEFIALQRADAKDVLEKLEKIFERPQSPAGTPGVPVAPRAPRVSPEGIPIPPDATATSSGPNSVSIDGGTLSEDSLVIGKIKLTADVRTNRIQIITRPVNLKFIHSLIKEFDADVPFGEPSIRPLRFVAAGDILGTIVRAITEPGQKSEGEGGDRGSTSGTNRNTGTNTNDLFSRNSNSNSGFGNSGTGLGSGGSGGGSTLSASLNTAEREVVPEARIVGSTKIIADKRQNAIIVLGNRQVRDKIFALIDQLDVRTAQVMINTVIGELNLGEKQKFGVNYIVSQGRRKDLVGSVTTTGNNNNGNNNGNSGDGSATGSVANSNGAISVGANNASTINLANLLRDGNIQRLAVGGGTGLSGFIAVGSAFNAIVDALESTDRFKVISRPSIFTSNNKKAIIASGEQIAVPVSTTGGFSGNVGTTGNGLVTQSNIQYKDVQLKLEVLPLINSEREVTLEIVQTIDQQSGADIIDNNSIPRIATRSLSTTVSVPNEGTLVLGGLIKQTDSRSTSGIPILSKLPWVGALFRTTTKEKMRTELVILIRPVVTIGPSEDIRGKERAMEALRIDPDVEQTIYPTNLHKKSRYDEIGDRLGDAPPVLRGAAVTEVTDKETVTIRKATLPEVSTTTTKKTTVRKR